MGIGNSNVKKSSLIAAALFAVACVIYSILMISELSTSAIGKNIQRGILAGLFAILSITNYLKYKRAKA